jgi:hypothetical protein
MKEHFLHLKAIDRAGNEQQYDYRFMKLDLPDAMDDSFLLQNSSGSGGNDDRTLTSGGTLRNLPSDGGGWYFIGAGGGWGFSSGWGSGGSGHWNPAPIGWTPTLPAIPGQDPEAQLAYIPALEVILGTAIDALSHHAQTANKKQALQNYRDELLGVGRIVEGRSFYTQFDSELHQLFSNAYDSSDGQISWTQAVEAGWDFAKAIALDPKPVALKTFETQIWGMVRSMMVEQNLTTTTEELTTLRDRITQFSRSYVRLHPEQESTSGGEGWRLEGFADYAWTGGWATDINDNSVQLSNNAWLGDVYGDWQTLMAGMDVAQLTRSFEAANTLIQGATRVVLLHRDGYQNVRSIHEGGFLRELIELGFELTRTGAVNPAGTVQTSAEWLEAVLEGNVRMVAGGLGQYVQGFEGNYGSSGYSYTNAYRDGLDYLQRLMKAAVAVDDPSLQPQMRDAKFLSHLVNLGGAYAGLAVKMNSYQATEDLHFFMSHLWQSQDVTTNSQHLEEFLTAFLPNRQEYSLEYLYKLARTLQNLTNVTWKQNLQNALFVDRMMEWGSAYVISLDNDSLFVYDPDDFFLNISLLSRNGQVIVASSDLNHLSNKLEDSLAWQPLWQPPQPATSGIAEATKASMLSHIRFLNVQKLLRVTHNEPNGVISKRLELIMKEFINQGIWKLDSNPVQVNVMFEKMSAILAIGAHESGRFEKKLEDASGSAYEWAIEHMNQVAGDGPRYKGRGFVQVTGRIRYHDLTVRAKSGQLKIKGVSNLRDLDFIKNPQILEQDNWAAFTLVDYFVAGRATTKSAMDWSFGDGTERPQGWNFAEKDRLTKADPRGYRITVRNPGQTVHHSGYSWNGGSESYLHLGELVNNYRENTKALQEIPTFGREYSKVLNQKDKQNQNVFKVDYFK